MSTGPDPRVSVVLPTHDRAHLLAAAVQSALGQTFGDLEVLVIDDGSSDDTPRVVEAIRDPRVRLLRQAGHLGASQARNRGIDEARGALVAFLDSDDRWLPQKLEREVARLAACDDPRASVVYSRSRGYDDRARRAVPHPRATREGDVFLHLLGGWHPATASCVAVTRSALRAVGGFDEELPSSQDHDLWLRLAQAGNRFAAVDEILVVKHENVAAQISTDPAAHIRSLAILERRWGPVIRREVGSAAYRRWRRRHCARIQYAYFVRVREAVEAGDRAGAWRAGREMSRWLPWSRRSVPNAVAMLVSAGAYRALARVRARLARVSTRGSAA